jgi:hypothetical protein
MFLEEIEKILPLVAWRRTDGPKDHDAKYFMGNHSGWLITAISFDIEDQGFPKGTRGYDGAAASGKVLMRLTRELAEKAIKLAEEQETNASRAPQKSDG